MVGIFTARFRRTRGLAVTFFSHPFSVGPTVRREREGWSHREEEEGERERGGPTVRRKRERGRGVVPP